MVCEGSSLIPHPKKKKTHSMTSFITNSKDNKAWCITSRIATAIAQEPLRDLIEKYFI